MTTHPKKIRVALGDVFAIPVDGKRVGYAQAVSGARLSFYFGVSSRVDEIGAPPDLATIVTSHPLFLAETTVNRIHEGIWTSVGHADVPPNIPFPIFKMRRSGAVYLCDHLGTVLRRATEAEAARLDNPFSVSPVRFEQALRAELGLEPWSDDFNRLRPRPRPPDVPSVKPAEALEATESELAPTVAIHISLAGGDFGSVEERSIVHALELRLRDVIAAERVGAYDGNEFGGSEAVIYASGPDADRLFDVLERELSTVPLRPAYATIDYGGDETRPERRVDFA